METKLKNFLNLFWLRPESGLMLTFKSQAFANIKFESPSLEISCGDGLFMFLHLGGIFDKDFDYFKSTTAKIFNHSEFTDIYDSCKEDYKVDIVKRPTTVIDYGTDWKQGLLDKASRLGIYKNLTHHDNNKTPLPFPDNHFKTIYSNSAYWIKDIKNLLLDIRRMLRPDGTAVLEVLSPYLMETLTDMEKYLPKKAIDILDRQRRATMHTKLKTSDWKKLMRECGFKIEQTKCVYPNKLLIDIWNIGLRPISHLLIQMPDDLKRKIKEEWVEIFYELFKPLLKLPMTYKTEEYPYILFVLKKESNDYCCRYTRDK